MMNEPNIQEPGVQKNKVIEDSSATNLAAQSEQMKSSRFNFHSNSEWKDISQPLKSFGNQERVENSIQIHKSDLPSRKKRKSSPSPWKNYIGDKQIRKEKQNLTKSTKNRSYDRTQSKESVQIYLQAQKKLRELRKQRQDTLKKINNLYEKEYQMRLVQKSRMIISRKSLERSHLIAKQEKKVKEILLMIREHQKGLEDKTTILLKKINQQNRQYQQSLKLRLVERQLQKRQELLQKRKKLQTQVSRESIQRIQPTKKRFSVQYSHLKYLQVDLKKKEEQEEIARKLHQQNKERLKTDFQEIRKFAQSYRKNVKLIEATKKKSRKQIKNKLKQSNYEQNSFARKLREEKEEMKIKIEKRQSYPREFQSRILQYRSYIYQNFFPPKKATTIIDGIDETPKRQKRNSYLEGLKKNIKYRTVSNERKSPGFQLKLIKNTDKYHNYLKDFRSSRRKSLNPQTQLDNLSKQQSLTISQITKAASISEKLNHNIKLKLKNMNQQDYYQAKNKIKLLESLYKSDRI